MDILSVIRAALGWFLEILNLIRGIFTGRDTETTDPNKDYEWNHPLD